MYVQPLDGQLGPATFAPLEAASDSVLSPAQSAPAQSLGSEDGISRFVPPGISNAMLQSPMQTALFGPLSGLLQQLMQMLQSMTGYQGYGGCGGYGNEQYFSNASGSSTGDPHLSFNGSHWDSMSSQPDLLDSNSIPGGFQISTQVTPPNGRGVTWNQSATVALDGGRTTVSLNNEGQATLREGDRVIPLSAGQTMTLGNGTTVSSNANGCLSVIAQNGYGGRIETTLTAQGQGVNVETNAHNVDLGGSLVAGNQQAPIGYGGPPRDPWQPIIQAPIGGGPITAPVSFPIPAPYPQPIQMQPY